MKRAITVGVVLCLAASCAFAAERHRREQKVEHEVRKTEAARVKALLDQDFATLEVIYADDYLSFDSRSGVVHQEANVIANLKSGTRRIISVDDQDVVIRIFENTAVITGLSRSVVMTNARSDAGPGRYIHVYAKRKGNLPESEACAVSSRTEGPG